MLRMNSIDVRKLKRALRHLKLINKIKNTKRGKIVLPPELYVVIGILVVTFLGRNSPRGSALDLGDRTMMVSILSAKDGCMIIMTCTNGLTQHYML
jgi:ABC-type molybdate transport system permease subunit